MINSAKRVLGARLFKAAKALRIKRLADALDEDAHSVELQPKQVHTLPPLRQVAVLEIINGTEPPGQRLERGSEFAQAFEIVKHRWRQFSTFENYVLTSDQRRRVRTVLEHVDGAGSAIVTAARKRASENASVLATKLRAAAEALDADQDLARVASGGIGWRQSDRRPGALSRSISCSVQPSVPQQRISLPLPYQAGPTERALICALTDAAEALESEAKLQERLEAWHGHVETRGGKNMQRAQAIDLLVSIYESITGKKAHASWNPNVGRNNRETPFVRFVSDMLRKAGHEDW